MSDKPVRRMTVSEFIRTTKPDWEHVCTVDKRASTGTFSGAPVVRVEGRKEDPMNPDSGRLFHEPFEDQLDEQNQQMLGLQEPDTFWGEVTVTVDDLD